MIEVVHNTNLSKSKYTKLQQYQVYISVLAIFLKLLAMWDYRQGKEHGKAMEGGRVGERPLATLELKKGLGPSVKLI